MLIPKLRHHRTHTHVFVAALTFATGITPAPAQTKEFDRYEIEFAVWKKAPFTVVDAENLRFEVRRYETPGSDRQVGFVCGRIMPLPKARFSETMHSYHALLFVSDGILSVGPVVAFFKPIEELLQDTMCQ